MLRTSTTSTVCRKAVTIARRNLSSNASSSTTTRQSSALAGDTGRKATHLHHAMTSFLAIAAPVVMFTPDSYTDGMINKGFGMLVATTVSAHSWIGMNYVATDYVPKVSKALVGPARVFNAALGLVTFVGLSKIALNDKGGIKGAIKGLWRPQQKE
jgi:succinate dehydrogenase hydrophobic anchor subunit